MAKKKVNKKFDYAPNITPIYFEQQTAPRISEQIGIDWILYGEGEYKNLYPQFIIDLYYNSSTHAAVVNATSEMIAGEDLILDVDEETYDQTLYQQAQQILGRINKRETLHDLVKKISFDLKLQGSFALNIIWSQDRTHIAEIYHVPVERLRVGKPNEMGVIDTYFISPDWKDYRKVENQPTAVPAYDPNDRTSPSQILYTGTYSPGMDIYYTPDYCSATNWILTDQQVAEFHLSNIANGFAPSYFIAMNNGIPSAEERQQIEQQIKDKFAGASNAGKFILTFNEDRERSPEINPIQVSNADKQYTVLNELVIQNIMIGHRVTSPMLLGVKTEGQLGGRNELLEAFDLYLNSVIKPYQKLVLRTLKTLLRVNNINCPIAFQQTSPFSNKFGFETMKEVMTEDEIREELGLEPLSAGEETAEEEMSAQTFSRLEKFIEECGEEEPEDYELVDEDEIHEEHRDFDFEEELNSYHFARSGSADTNADSEQDGFSPKALSFYKVRYKYSEDSGLSRKSGQSREFCNKMMGANLVYRKEDILALENEAVNPGWGEGGSSTYDIWLYKGGGNCHHRWIRKIYKLTLNEEYHDTDVEMGELISTAKARSEGFYPESNDYDVATAPKRMDKSGFVNKKGY